MKVAALSDMHGILPTYDFESDIVCICGDISPLRIQNNMTKMLYWIENVFIPWTNTLNCGKIFLIAGNHDRLFENRNGKELLMHSNIIYLEDDLVEHDGKLIYGTPWCKVFGNWSFMLYPEGLQKMYAKIPENVDLLLTHDVPYECNDVILDPVPWANGEHIGNPQLLEVMKEKKPASLCCGHLHSTDHTPIEFYDTIVRQCSIVGEDYKVHYEPQIFEI